MIVEDSLITAKKLSTGLAALGHEVVHVSRTGADAVASYGRVLPDLVTMDITMPEMDGVQATRAIIAAHPEALIVMVTSHGQEQMVADALEAGAKAYLTKPLKIETLQATVAKLVARFKRAAP
jgi:two-component system chemotaxis response regulator CheY